MVLLSVLRNVQFLSSTFFSSRVFDFTVELWFAFPSVRLWISYDSEHVTVQQMLLYSAVWDLFQAIVMCAYLSNSITFLGGFYVWAKLQLENVSQLRSVLSCRGQEELTAHRHRSGFIFRRGKPTNPVIETLLDRSSDFVAAGHLRMSRCRFEGVRCRYITCEKTAHCTRSLCSD